jgi:hypothetical protein
MCGLALPLETSGMRPGLDPSTPGKLLAVLEPCTVVGGARRLAAAFRERHMLLLTTTVQGTRSSPRFVSLRPSEPGVE